MNWTFWDLMSAVRNTIFAPEAAAREILSSELSMAQRWQITALVAIFGTGVTILSMSVAQVSLGFGMDQGMIISPFVIFLGVALQLVVAGFLVSFLGKLFGGVGSFPDALIAVVWIEFVLGVARLISVLVTTALPFMGSAIAMLIGGLYVWLLTHFVMQMHGFQSFLKVFLAIFVALLAIGLLASSFIGGMMSGMMGGV